MDNTKAIQDYLQAVNNAKQENYALNITPTVNPEMVVPASLAYPERLSAGNSDVITSIFNTPTNSPQGKAILIDSMSRKNRDIGEDGKKLSYKEQADLLGLNKEQRDTLKEDRNTKALNMTNLIGQLGMAVTDAFASRYDPNHQEKDRYAQFQPRFEEAKAQLDIKNWTGDLEADLKNGMPAFMGNTNAYRQLQTDRQRKEDIKRGDYQFNLTYANNRAMEVESKVKEMMEIEAYAREHNITDIEPLYEAIGMPRKRREQLKAEHEANLNRKFGTIDTGTDTELSNDQPEDTKHTKKVDLDTNDNLDAKEQNEWVKQLNNKYKGLRDKLPLPDNMNLSKVRKNHENEVAKAYRAQQVEDERRTNEAYNTFNFEDYLAEKSGIGNALSNSVYKGDKAKAKMDIIKQLKAKNLYHPERGWGQMVIAFDKQPNQENQDAKLVVYSSTSDYNKAQGKSSGTASSTSTSSNAKASDKKITAKDINDVMKIYPEVKTKEKAISVLKQAGWVE